MAALNLIVKPFLTPAMLELVKRNGSGAASAGFPGASRVGYNPIGGMGAGPPPGPPPGYAGPPAPYNAGPYGAGPGGGKGEGGDSSTIRDMYSEAASAAAMTLPYPTISVTRP